MKASNAITYVTLRGGEIPECKKAVGISSFGHSAALHDQGNLFRVGARINPLFHRFSLIIVKRDSNDACDVVPLQVGRLCGFFNSTLLAAGNETLACPSLADYAIRSQTLAERTTHGWIDTLGKHSDSLSGCTPLLERGRPEA